MANVAEFQYLLDFALEAKPEWSAKADNWLETAPSGYEFTSEDLTSAIGYPDEDNGINTNNAIGAKVRSWAKSGLTEKNGYINSINARSHGRVVAKWRKK